MAQYTHRHAHVCARDPRDGSLFSLSGTRVPAVSGLILLIRMLAASAPLLILPRARAQGRGRHARWRRGSGRLAAWRGPRPTAVGALRGGPSLALKNNAALSIVFFPALFSSLHYLFDRHTLLWRRPPSPPSLCQAHCVILAMACPSPLVRSLTTRFCPFLSSFSLCCTPTRGRRQTTATRHESLVFFCFCFTAVVGIMAIILRRIGAERGSADAGMCLFVDTPAALLLLHRTK